MLATALTPVTESLPFGPVNATSDAVNVGALIFLSNVTRTVLNEVEFEPVNTAETTFGPRLSHRSPGVLDGGGEVTGGDVTGGTMVEAPSNFPKSIRPPEATFPLNLVTGSTEIFNFSRICEYVHVGWRSHSSARAPLMTGVAIDVPLLVMYPPPRAVLRMLSPGAAISTLWGP